MKHTFSYFEIKSPDDSHGLCGTFETAEEALEHINFSYRYALERGYDNSHENWVIVCVECVKEFNDKGEFLKEETIRYIWMSAQFSFYDNAYVEAV